MRSTIPLTARAPRSFTPPTLAAKFDKDRDAWASTGDKKRADRPEKPVFHIAVPTLVERETIGQLMYELGVIPVSRETVRNATLRAILDSPREDAEETATWLEGYWQQTEIYEEQLETWQQQENQRLIDEWKDPKSKREAFPMPAQLTTLRDRIRAKDLVDEIVASDRDVRRLLAAQTRYGKVYEIMGMRVHLRGWENLKTERQATGGGDMPELVTEDCIHELREEIGQAAWGELWASIDSSYGLSAEEVGNFDSPPGSGSMSDGSKAGEGETDSGTSPGTAEGSISSSEPTPEAASEAITEPSSGSGGDAKE